MIFNLIQYLEARKNSDDIALADKNASLSYRGLWEKASAVGAELCGRVGSEGRPVMVSIGRDIDSVAAFYGVLMSGNFYVPADPELPPARLKKMLELTRPAAVIGQRLEPFEKTGVPCIDVFSAPYRECAGWKRRKDTDPVYVIFTSGSTGSPKGVAVSHRSVIDMAEQFTDALGLSGCRVFANQAPFDFDVSVKDLYIALKNGARVEILEKMLFSFPKLLTQRLCERGADTLIWAVPAFRLPAMVRAFDACRPESLRTVMFSGEVMPSSIMEYLISSLPGVRFFNLYGPTEITCNCTFHEVKSFSPGEPIPIGRAFPNCSVFLLDGDTPVTEPGVPGEICVTGSCVALGYYNMPEETARAFVPDPQNAALCERMYRTGDIGVLNERGELVFKGRRDGQIKHMGHRIELSEIELCSNACGARESACVYKDENIFLFYCGDISPEELLPALKARLPVFMLPKRAIRLEAFPATRTGKISRTELLKMI